MDKYIPREKLSKKARRKLDADRRGTWGAVNPVTRSVKNEKAYNRKKAPQGDGLSSRRAFWFCFALYIAVPNKNRPVFSDFLPPYRVVLLGGRQPTVVVRLVERQKASKILGPFSFGTAIILHDNLIEIPNLLVGAGPNQAYQQIAVGDGILKELFV